MKKIYCPLCGKHVATHDGRTKTPVISHCKDCKKRVIYHVEEDEIEVKNIPPRNCSSGMTFW